MTKPDTFDEPTAQWVYDKMRINCNVRSLGVCMILAETKHGSMCAKAHTNCPLFKDAKEER